VSRQKDVVDLVVDVPGGFMPNIWLDKADKNGREDGRGAFRRVFYRNASVDLEAQAIYGECVFMKWVDNDTKKDLGSEPILQLTFNDNRDSRSISAVYERIAQP
jgi:hypothetical protein